MGLVSGNGGSSCGTNPIHALEQYRVLRLDLGGTAVHEELDAVDETRIAGGKEEGDGRDLLRTSHFAARDLGLEELLSVGSEGIKDRRIDRAGTEDVHANSALLEFQQPSASEGADRGLASAVDAERREALDAGNGS